MTPRPRVALHQPGIAFPPDWVGNFIYDVDSDENIDRLFVPGTVRM